MAELGEGGVEGAGVPQHDGVEDEAERSELVFLAFSVALAELAALAVEDLAGEGVAGFGAPSSRPRSKRSVSCPDTALLQHRPHRE